MKITSAILALSAVIALTQAQAITPDIANPLGAIAPAQGLVGTLKGAAEPVLKTFEGAAGPVTGSLPQTPALRRRQNGGIVDSAKSLLGQNLPAGVPSLPLRKRGPVETVEGYPGLVLDGAKKTADGITNSITQKVGDLTQGTVPPPVKRTLGALPDLAGAPLNAEEVLQKIPVLKNIVESAFVSEIKKAVEDKTSEVGHVAVFVSSLKAEVVKTVTTTVDAEIVTLKAKISELTGLDIETAIQSSFEHCCAVLIPKVNELLQKYPLTKNIVLETPKMADVTFAKIVPMIENALAGLKPKVDDTVKTVKDKVDELKSTVPLGVPQVPVV